MDKSLDSNTQKYIDYLFETNGIIKELAYKAKDDFDKSRETDSYNFYSGRFMGVYHVISLLHQQAIAFDIDLNDINLADIDPDRDLL